MLDFFDDHLGDSIYASIKPFAVPTFSALSTSTSNLTTIPLLSSSSLLQSTTATNAIQFLSDNISNLPRDSILRQSLSLYALVYVGILLLYFSIATFSYYAIFDHRMKLHPRFLKNQVSKEIQFSLDAFPMLDLLTLPWFVGDVRGWSMLYDTMESGPFGAQGGWKPWVYMAASAAVFLLFTDFCIYWIHRILHIPVLYKKLHKPHHKWISKQSSPLLLSLFFRTLNSVVNAIVVADDLLWYRA